MTTSDGDFETPTGVQTGPWWTAPEYTGELELPGQSRLDAQGRAILEELASKVDAKKVEIPPMPKAAMETVRLLRSADPDLDAVAGYIKLDPGLSLQVLRHANSALYGARHPIETLPHALRFLGLRRLKQCVLEAAMKKLADGVGSETYAKLEWRFSLACANISARLCQKLGIDKELGYMAGLLHDIGRLPLIGFLARRGALDEPPIENGSTEIILEALHRGVGLHVAEDWDLPPAVCDAVGNHLTGRLPDEPPMGQFPTTAVTEAAGDILIAMGIGRVKRPFDILHTPSVTDLGLPSSEWEAFLEDEIPDILGLVSGLT